MVVKSKFPKLWYDFSDGKFVVHQTKQKGSGIPMDQALEKQYKKPAKDPSGITRFTRSKEAVCKWNIIKHENFLYTQALSKICQLKTEDQHSLHHEFSETATQDGRESAAKMIQFIEKRSNPFNVSSTEMENLSSGEQLDPKLVGFRIKCTTKGEEEYQKFKKQRLEKKSVKLFDLIPKLVMENGSKQQKERKIDVNKLTVEFMRQVE